MGRIKNCRKASKWPFECDEYDEYDACDSILRLIHVYLRDEQLLIVGQLDS